MRSTSLKVGVKIYCEEYFLVMLFFTHLSYLFYMECISSDFL